MSNLVEIIDEPREFAVEELFFSTTDPKGRIQRANVVFQRIAGYSWDELRNKPHNIVRHPDMPRIVFQLLWDYIQAGRPIVAFVKNLAHDRRYYWVVALVVPISTGFLSVRFKPTSPLLANIKQLYAALRAVEASIEEGSNDRKAAIAASREALGAKLQTLGFSSYDDFMQHALKTEMQSREAKLRAFASRAAGQEAEGRFAASDSFSAAVEMCDRLVELLNVLFADLEAYVHITDSVRAQSGNVTDVSESLRVSALNGVIAVDKLGVRAAGLRPVLDWLRLLSGEITQEGVHLATSLDELVRGVDRVVFGLSAAKLQTEMTAQFAHELLDRAPQAGIGANIHNMTEGAVGDLHRSSCETVRGALDGLAAIRDKLNILTGSQTRLLDSSRSLRPIYLTGRIEMAGEARSTLAKIFKDVGDQMEKTAANLNGLKDVLQGLETHLVRGLAHGERVEEAIGRIRF